MRAVRGCVESRQSRWQPSRGVRRGAKRRARSSRTRSSGSKDCSGRFDSGGRPSSEPELVHPSLTGALLPFADVRARTDRCGTDGYMNLGEQGVPEGSNSRQPATGARSACAWDRSVGPDRPCRGASAGGVQRVGVHRATWLPFTEQQSMLRFAGCGSPRSPADCAHGSLTVPNLCSARGGALAPRLEVRVRRLTVPAAGSGGTGAGRPGPATPGRWFVAAGGAPAAWAWRVSSRWLSRHPGR